MLTLKRMGNFMTVEFINRILEHELHTRQISHHYLYKLRTYFQKTICISPVQFICQILEKAQHCSIKFILDLIFHRILKEFGTEHISGLQYFRNNGV